VCVCVFGDCVYQDVVTLVQSTIAPRRRRRGTIRGRSKRTTAFTEVRLQASPWVVPAERRGRVTVGQTPTAQRRRATAAVPGRGAACPATGCTTDVRQAAACVTHAATYKLSTVDAFRVRSRLLLL